MATLSEVGLRHVREDELDALKERLARHLPHSMVVYGTVSMAVRYGLPSLQPASILVPAYSPPSCLTIITTITSSTKQCLLVFWSLEENSAKEMADYIFHLPHLNWNEPVILYCLPAALLPALQSLNIWEHRQVKFQATHIGHLYQLKASTIMDADLPRGYDLTGLRKKDAMEVWTHWDSKKYDSVEGVKNDIIRFPSVSIRKRRPVNGAVPLLEEEEEMLVAWVRTYKIGLMGNTFTMPQHRRQGLARVATISLANQLLQEGLLAFVGIEKSNSVSVKFHEKLGFERQSELIVVSLPSMKDN